jgi:hypothetical protein
VFDPLAVALVIAYNITMVNRQQGSLDGGTTVNPIKKKKPKRLGLYKEGKSMMEKIVKETFIPDEEEVKKDDEVIKEVIEEKKNKKIGDTSKHRGAIHFPKIEKIQKKEKVKAFIHFFVFFLFLENGLHHDVYWYLQFFYFSFLL